jgi:hypothetical protein
MNLRHLARIKPKRRPDLDAGQWYCGKISAKRAIFRALR